MRKGSYAGLGFLLCMGIVAGCGNELSLDTDMVYVKKDGQVVSVNVEEFGEAYYDKAGLEEKIHSVVDTYNAENGKDTVKVQELAVEDGVAALKMKYKTAADYSSINDVELYDGEVGNAMAAGYDFAADFIKVENGTIVSDVTKADILAQEDLKVVIIKENTNVKVDGTIVYVSSENVAVTGADMVTVGSRTDEETADSTEMGMDVFVIEGEIILDTEQEEIEVQPETEAEEWEDIILDLSDTEKMADTYAYIIYQ